MALLKHPLYWLVLALLFQPMLTCKAEEAPPYVISDYSQLVGRSLWPNDEPVTFTELRALEPLCKLILTNWIARNWFWLLHNREMPIFQKPEFRMGYGANWTHHYCHGKLAKFRYLTSPSKTARAFNLKQWQDEMEYSINAASGVRDYAYRYDILTELAEIYYYNNSMLLAITNATRAIAENKQHVRAYRVLADSYIKIKDRDKALVVVNDGLKQAPDAKSLILLRAELTGKTPPPAASNQPTN